MTTSTDLIAKIDTVRQNPIAMQRVMLQQLEDMSNGQVVIIDPTNPFVFALEAGCCAAAAGMAHTDASVRRLYPSVAETDEDLYLHMSDKDYLSRFASPARTTITVLLNKREAIDKAVRIANSDNCKLVIPRHTEFTVADIPFAMQYPIEVRVVEYVSEVGGNPTTSRYLKNVVFDVSSPSPLYSIENNQVDWGTASIDGVEYIYIKIPVIQVHAKTQVAQMNNITGFTKAYDFTDNFYYCRAYIRYNNAVQWTEIRTTHTEQVYDPSYPTAVLKVLNQRLGVHIPQIYFNNGAIQDSLRIDIYTTKGPMETILSNYVPGAFSAKWMDRDRENTSGFVAPLLTFSGLSMFSDDVVTGGTNGVTFTELRERVITRSLSNPQLPITNAQLDTSLADLGYDMVTNLDNVTNRQFLATRLLPAPTDGSTVTGAGSSINTFQSKIENLAVLDTGFNTDPKPPVSDNGNRITIKPSMVFNNVNGVLQVVPTNVVQTLKNPLLTTEDALAANVNAQNYLYSPFYYVLDVTADEFFCRPYRLDDPSVTAKYFIAENAESNIEVSTKTAAVMMNSTGAGYSLLLDLRVGENFKNLALNKINVQLSYVPPNSTTRVFFDGTLVSTIDIGTGKPVNGRYIYRFDLDTTFDVDANHNLIFRDAGSPAALTTEFDLVYVIGDHMPINASYSNIDTLVSTTNMQPATTYLGVTHERVTVKFGDYLKHLWTRTRTVAGSEEYVKYATDVFSTYPQTVYERDPLTGNIVLHSILTPPYLTFTVLHEAGDPVLTVLGQSAFNAWLLLNPGQTVNDWWATLSNVNKHTYGVVAHAAGDVVLDEFGQPTVLNGSARGLVRQMDLFMLDGKYYFANDETTTQYVSDLVKTITSWVTTDLETISQRLLERSEIFFHPKTSVGKLKVIVGENQQVYIDADQSFTVRFYMERDKYADLELRDSLSKLAAESLAASLTEKTISVTSMVSNMKAAAGNDVLTVEVLGFTGGLYPAVTLLDSSMHPTIAKRLIALSNKTVAVQDDINVEFVRHV